MDGDAVLEQVSVVVEVAYDAVAVLLAVVYKGEDEALLVNQPRMLDPNKFQMYGSTICSMVVLVELVSEDTVVVLLVEVAVWEEQGSC